MSDQIHFSFVQLRAHAFSKAQPPQLSAKEAIDGKSKAVATHSAAYNDVNYNHDSQPLRYAQGTSQAVDKTTDNQIQLSELVSPLEFLQKNTQHVNRSLEFSFDDTLNQTIITVKDRDSDEVIRQIPAETLINIARKFNESSELLPVEHGVIVSTIV